jgi:anhydro-N-acetylmuramic acid kinase
MRSVRAIGLMSGTSLDGIDAALVELSSRAHGYAVETLAFRTLPFEAGLRERIVAALPPYAPEPRAVALLDAALGRAFGEAAASVASGEVDFIASPGLTLYHDGSVPVSAQIGDPYAIRERTGVTVVFDFRRADVAAGGQGAPLVPYVDRLLFADATRDVVALNLGGIANVTVLAKNAGSAPRAWDTGPGNMLIDAFVRRRSGGTRAFDAGGMLAARGRVSEDALQALQADPYFRQAPPKSTGRERFGDAYLESHARVLAALSDEDGCATLTALSARTICTSLAAFGASGARIVASGGGTHNATLMGLLRAEHEVDTSQAFGIDPDAKEAIAFAILGLETLRGRPSGVPSATGARHAAVLGAIAPVEPARLLEKIARTFANASA